MIPALPWSELGPRIRWEQGEHVSIIGRTGGGKTTLALELIRRRAYVCVLATKPTGKDEVLSSLRRAGYRSTATWPAGPADMYPRVLLWPKYSTSADTDAQAATIAAGVQGMFSEGGWCLVADETAWLCRRLHLENDLRDLWQQGRSLGLSLVAITQRPAAVPLEMYTQATHLFLFRQTGKEDLARLGSLPGVVDSRVLRDTVKALPKNEFVYLDLARDRFARSRLVLTKRQ